ncbi:hypothetical protein BURMUCF1_A2078 [Burkholderia multivorans ATCC BAA-247]|uniref:Uncharacterized protein n=1 Tax=Burkholderia multivorans CGD2 TaxID=513052 RepID=B9BYN5_9BURK|nr:hypothetical protein BURMUCGD2_3592 [Burkholderia multivorans CGD2]EEE11622.1 hypothetical protein BURMUCGD2M_3581 [Burkholderia multivorans CGD2M]EJO58415.1 hypothetical protein BURMUCF1_A2078 [Burkholderia multivorans ATCC BAA-247]
MPDETEGETGSRARPAAIRVCPYRADPARRARRRPFIGALHTKKDGQVSLIAVPELP